MIRDFNPKTIAIVISTRYPKWYKGRLKSNKNTDKVRGDLCLELVRKSSKIGYQVVMIDTLSSKTFRKALSLIPNLHLIKKNVPIKRSPVRRLGFKIASKIPGIEVIIYNEPEKISLIDSIPEIVKPILENKADIVVPKRNDNLFKTSYPEYQYQSETEANNLYNSQLKIKGLLSSKSEELDMFFGPRAFKNTSQILSLFTKKVVFSKKIRKATDSLEFEVEEFSNALFFPIVSALKKGFKVLSVEIKFTYPKLQKENEEVGSKELFIAKRNAQKMSILIELMYFIDS